MLKILLVCLLCVGLAAGAASDCSTCSNDSPTFTCSDANNTVTSCRTSCNANESTVFSLTAKDIDFFPHSGENVTLAANLTANESTTVDINVTVLVNGEEFTGTRIEDEYVYVITDVSKDNEGWDVVFQAEGKMDDEQLCSSITLSIKYVYTVEIQMEETNFVFKHCDTACGGEIIAITVFADETAWDRVILSETSPYSGPIDGPETSTGSLRVYDYHVASPKKLSHETDYVFSAVEHSSESGKAYTTPDVVLSVYVHSTILTATQEAYYAEENQNLTLPVTAVTELDTWDNVEFQVVTPHGEVVSDITIETEGQSADLSFEIVNVNLTRDAGEYIFTAIEVTETHGNTTDSVKIKVFGLSITSKLLAIDDAYIVNIGTEGSISCKLMGESGNVSWYWNGTMVSTDTASSSKIYQIDGEVEDKVLVVTDSAFFFDDVFTCKTIDTVLSASKDVKLKTSGVQITDISEKSDLTFTCTARGNPKPNIVWKINDETIEDDSYFSESLTAESDPFTVTSTMSILEQPWCFGDQNLTCNAFNADYSVEDVLAINTGDISVHENHYIIFPGAATTRADAQDECTELGASLVQIENVEARDVMMLLADKAGITEFYIGAKTDENGDWKWPDGTDVTYPTLVSNEEECSKISKNSDGEWNAATVGCETRMKFACQVKATGYPTDMELTASECAGENLTATWQLEGKQPEELIIYLVTFDESLPEENKTLISETTEMQFYGLLPETEYRVKVEAVLNSHCSLNPYTEQKTTTGASESPPPNQVEISNVNDTACKISWEYHNGNQGKVEQFFVVVTESVKQNPTESEERTYAVQSGKELTIQARTNSAYSAKVYAESDCQRNSTGADATGTCTTHLAAPESVPLPEWSKEQSGGVTIHIPAVDDRNGELSCQFVVVRYVRPDISHSSPDIDEGKFNNIKDASVDVINVGEDYFAFATKRLSSPKTITLGDGAHETECAPLLDSSRRKREISTNQAYSALNRPIKYGTQLQYYMITTTPSDDGKTVYFADSGYSATYVLHQPASNTPNVAVILLSIFAVILVSLVGLFCIRRWRARRKSMSDSSRIFRFTKEHHYDVL